MRKKIDASAKNGTLHIGMAGVFDMGFYVDLWEACRVDQGLYHTYVFNLMEVTELRDTGLDWLMAFKRKAKRVGASVQLVNCSHPIAARCHSAGLRLGPVVHPKVDEREAPGSTCVTPKHDLSYA